MRPVCISNIRTNILVLNIRSLLSISVCSNRIDLNRFHHSRESGKCKNVMTSDS